jgi:hypothetical protein
MADRKSVQGRAGRFRGGGATVHNCVAEFHRARLIAHDASGCRLNKQIQEREMSGMVRKVACVVAALAALSVSIGPASAGGRHKDKAALRAAEIGVGAATTALYFGINDWNWKWDAARAGISQTGAIVGTTIGCAAASPMVATALLKRPLKYREAHMLIAGCVVPVVGSWLVEKAYDNHILWAPDEAPAKAKKKLKKRAHR